MIFENFDDKPLGCLSCGLKEAEVDYRKRKEGAGMRYEITCKSCKGILRSGFSRVGAR